MKIQTLFDLLGSAQDFLSHFDKVSTPEQLVSRIAVLRRQDPEDMLYDLLTLRATVDSALNAHIELGGALTDDDETPDGEISGSGNDMEQLLASFDDDEPESQTQGSQTPGSQTPGSQTPGSQTPGSQTQGSQTQEPQTQGSQTQPTVTGTDDKENPPS